jgi:hypothetical protein
MIIAILRDAAACFKQGKIKRQQTVCLNDSTTTALLVDFWG